MSYQMRRRRSSGGNGLVALLVVLGLLVLVGQFIEIAFMASFWPFFILAPGLALFYIVKRFGQSASILTIPATMITTLGLILFYQNVSGHWTSWAYAWSLLFPGAFGMGLAVYGELAKKPAAERAGEGMAWAGVALFLVGAIFFEVILGIGGLFGGLLATLLFPLLLIGAALYLMRRNRKPRGPRYIGAGSRKGLSNQPNHVETPIFDSERERV